MKRKRISQAALSDRGRKVFNRDLVVNFKVSIRIVKENGFKGINSQCHIWRYNNIELMQSRSTGAYSAVESYTWHKKKFPVANFEEYKARAKQ